MKTSLSLKGKPPHLWIMIDLLIVYDSIDDGVFVLPMTTKNFLCAPKQRIKPTLSAMYFYAHIVSLSVLRHIHIERQVETPTSKDNII